MFLIIDPIVCLALGRGNHFRKLDIFIALKNELWRFANTKKHHGKKTDHLLTYLAHIGEKFDNCGVSNGQAVCVLVYLLCHGAKEKHEAYTANEMSTDAHVCHWSWQWSSTPSFIGPGPKMCFGKHVT